MARNADVYLVRHPKSGGTWLRVLLTRLYANQYELSSNRAVRSDELRRQNRELPVLLSSSNYLSWERPFGEAMATDPRLRSKKLVVLSRHPADIAVSWYIQFTTRTSAFKREMMLHDMTDPIDIRQIDRWEFIQHPEVGLPSIIDYYNFCQRNLEQMEHAHLVRYEDLRSEPAGTLKKLGEFLGEDFSDEHIQEAVQFGSVDNMRELEKSGYFQNKSLRLRDPKDPSKLKVRRATVGGFNQDLSPEQVAEVEAMVNERLSPAFGYSSSEFRAP